MHRPRNRCTLLVNENTSENAFAWGHLNPLSTFQPTEFDEKYEKKNYVLTTSDFGIHLFLMPPVPSNKSMWRELGIWPNTQQMFEFSTDHSIRFKRNGTNYCLTVNYPNHLLFKIAQLTPQVGYMMITECTSGKPI